MTKVRRRDQLLNFQVGKFEFLDKSMTSKNDNADETEQIPLGLKLSRLEMEGTNDAKTNKIRLYGVNIKHYKTVETNNKK